MKNLSFNETWEVNDRTKDRLFNHLRSKIRELQRIATEKDLSCKDYRERFGEIHSSILGEWNEIKRKYEDYEDHRGKQLTVTLKGFLYEALFYHACLGTQIVFMDAEIAKMGGAEFPESPPWFEAIPLYEKIPSLYKVNGERKGPQIDADFIISYVSDEDPTAPALVDVKSSKPYPGDTNKKRWNWQILAAMRIGFTFQIAYPETGNRYPKHLSEWEFRAPCPKCGNLSKNCLKCDECDEDLFPFTIVDSYYREKQLWELFGAFKKGRF